MLAAYFSNIRVISHFNPTIAVIPFLGFFLGIWGILGCFLNHLIVAITYLSSMSATGEVQVTASYLISSSISVLLYSTLPSVLWYLIPHNGKTETDYPRLDTSFLVIKYYLISVVTIMIYMAVSLIGIEFEMLKAMFLDLAVSYAQYPDGIFIIGIPLLILISVIRSDETAETLS